MVVLSLDVLRETVADLVGHEIVEHLEVLALFLAEVGADELEQLRDALRPALLVVLELLAFLFLLVLVINVILRGLLFVVRRLDFGVRKRRQLELLTRVVLVLGLVALLRCVLRHFVPAFLRHFYYLINYIIE